MHQFCITLPLGLSISPLFKEERSRPIFTVLFKFATTLVGAASNL